MKLIIIDKLVKGLNDDEVFKSEILDPTRMSCVEPTEVEPRDM